MAAVPAAPTVPTVPTAPTAPTAPAAGVLPGAEAFSSAGGPVGVLVLHGFTGSPQSMRPVAEACAAAGYTVELPRLPGHGTSVADMLGTTWGDWSTAAEAAYDELAARVEAIVVVGLSMGGTLTLWLATRRPATAGIVVVNAAALPNAELLAGVEAMIDAGTETIDAIGNDVADPQVTELAYDAVPLRPLASLFRAIGTLTGELGTITCPTLVVTSEQDHVVDPANSEHIAASVAGSVERLRLTRSFHVATIDYDRHLIAARVVDFVERSTAA